MADQQPAQEPKPQPSNDETGRWPPQPMAVWPYTTADVRWARGERPTTIQAPQPASSAPTPPAPAAPAPAPPSVSACSGTSEPPATVPAAPSEVSAPTLSEAGRASAAPPRRVGLHRRAAQQPITGQQIRERRKALGWTQAQLAEKVGLSRPFIALVEQGRRVLSPDDLARVREALGI